jgi:Ni,Fe-hydrogenase III small subunit/NAD-dependent dihydropyrimidine dehydrogenase PreA subunit
MIGNIKILIHQGKQFIPDLTKADLPGIFRGTPVITNEEVDVQALIELCPVEAISSHPVSIDLGKCTFCGECGFTFPDKIRFTKDYRMATNNREKLVVKENESRPIQLDPELVRREILGFFKSSLKLRQVSAGGDNSCELELNACGNVNFDMGRFGIEFVASPRHADGIVITGPITENMAIPLQLCFEALPNPKIIILAGTDAISGGIFAGSKALNRNFLHYRTIDLYVPGNPIHPLTFINGVLELINSRNHH